MIKVLITNKYTIQGEGSPKLAEAQNWSFRLKLIRSKYWALHYTPYTLVINFSGGTSYFDILYHLFFILIHKISILEVFIVGIAVDENYVKQQKALFTITTHFK